jgi:hypothetical protein
MSTTSHRQEPMSRCENFARSFTHCFPALVVEDSPALPRVSAGVNEAAAAPAAAAAATPLLVATSLLVGAPLAVTAEPGADAPVYAARYGGRESGC